MQDFFRNICFLKTFTERAEKGRMLGDSNGETNIYSKGKLILHLFVEILLKI